MENEGNEIYAAFGLDAPAEADETTAPDETTGEPGPGPEDQKPDADASASANSLADDPREESNEADRPQENPENNVPETEPEPEAQPQPAEPDTSAQDANYAAAFMGRKNPYTGKPITTKAEFDEYVRQRNEAENRERQEEADKELEKIGITEDQLERLLTRTRFGKEIQAALDYTRKQAADSHRKAVDDLIQKDIADIAAFDPSVKDVDSLKKTAHGKEIEKRVASGRYTWKEAWMIENFGEFSSARDAAARQAAMNAAASKDHLQSTAQRGSGEVEVPDDVRAAFAAMDITDAEEQRSAYRDYLKSIKKG